MAKKSPEDHPGYKREGKPFNIHKEAWEMKYHSNPPKDRKNQIMGGDFDAMPSKDRYKTYIPVNETDT